MAIAFSSSVFADIVLIFITLGILAYLYIKHLYSYWSRRGVSNSLAPIFPFGNFKKTFLQKISIGELLNEFYNSTTQPFVAVYAGLRPMVIFRDPNLIRNVLTRDFQYFHDRGIYYDEKNDPLSAHMLAIGGEPWKNMRAKLSPTFTSGKLKAMFSTLVDSGVPLQKFLSKCAIENESVEMREVSAQFATNIIASVAFGIDINCIDNPDTDFRKYGRKVFELTLSNMMRQLISFISPGLMKFLRMRIFDKDVEDFMISVVKQNLKYREEEKVIRKDFFQLLVQIRNSNSVQRDDQWEVTVADDATGKALTIEQVAAHAFIFYIAGFETSSSTMSFCLYELARNPGIQQKLHEEIDAVLANHNGKLTYESVAEMQFLECCIDGKYRIQNCCFIHERNLTFYINYYLPETLRKYPPLPGLNRECSKDYTIPGTNVTIEKGTPILIPVYALHYDEQFYPNAKQFMPERFADANKRNFTEMPYLGFGDGPRGCIGMRMGKLQTKIGLISMLHKFRFELAKEMTNTELKISPKSFITAPIGGLRFNIKNRI